VFLWADGIYSGLRADDERLCALIVIGRERAWPAVGDVALGFWAALEEVFPATRQQRRWVHKTASLLNYLPKSAQAKAKAALHGDLDGRDQKRSR